MKQHTFMFAALLLLVVGAADGRDFYSAQVCNQDGNCRTIIISGSHPVSALFEREIYKSPVVNAWVRKPTEVLSEKSIDND